MKKILSFLLLSFSLIPVIGANAVHVELPDNWSVNQDLNTDKRTIDWNEETLYSWINYVNKYLWWSFAVICTAMVMYGWYKLITSNWDKKAMENALKALIGVAVWLCIAMLSYTIVTLLANLL